MKQGIFGEFSPPFPFPCLCLGSHDVLYSAASGLGILHPVVANLQSMEISSGHLCCGWDERLCTVCPWFGPGTVSGCAATGPSQSSLWFPVLKASSLKLGGSLNIHIPWGMHLLLGPAVLLVRISISEKYVGPWAPKYMIKRCYL